MREDLAELVARGLAEVGGATAKAGDTGCRIAGAAAGRFDGRAHARVQQPGSFGIDEVHGALYDAVFIEKGIVAARDDINDGIADRQHVVFCHEPRPVSVMAGVR
ncbi:hypothetical protein D9M72_571230 [compost metagenome]